MDNEIKLYRSNNVNLNQNFQICIYLLLLISLCCENFIFYNFFFHEYIYVAKLSRKGMGHSTSVFQQNIFSEIDFVEQDFANFRAENVHHPLSLFLVIGALEKNGPQTKPQVSFYSIHEKTNKQPTIDHSQ